MLLGAIGARGVEGVPCASHDESGLGQQPTQFRQPVMSAREGVDAPFGAVEDGRANATAPIPNTMASVIFMAAILSNRDVKTKRTI